MISGFLRANPAPVWVLSCVVLWVALSVEYSQYWQVYFLAEGGGARGVKSYSIFLLRFEGFYTQWFDLSGAEIDNKYYERICDGRIEYALGS